MYMYVINVHIVTTSTFFRKLRIGCFLENAEKTKRRKRPFSDVVEREKEMVRRYFFTATQNAMVYVEDLYMKKYNKTLVITR